MNLKKDLNQLLTAFRIQATERQLELLLAYKESILKWTETTNLISRNTKEDFTRIHLLDSLLPLKWLPESGPLLDLGSGGGLPGIVIGIMRPDLEVTLSETRSRKIKYLQSAVSALNLNNVGVLDPSTEKPEKKYRILVSRALGPLSKIIREAKKYLTQDGLIFAYKGRMEIIREELDAIPNNWDHEIRSYPNNQGASQEAMIERHIVFLKKSQ